MSSTLEDQPYRNSLNPIPDSDEEGTGEKANSAAPLAMRLSAPAFTPSLSTSIIPSATGRRRARSPASDSNSFNSALHPKRVAVQHDEALLGNLLKRLSAMEIALKTQDANLNAKIASQDSKIAAQDERIATQDEKIIIQTQQLEEYRQKLEEAERKLEEAEKAQIFNEDLIKVLREEIEVKMGEIAKLREEMGKKEGEIEEIARKAGTRVADVEKGAQQRIEEADLQISMANASAEEARHQLAEVRFKKQVEQAQVAKAHNAALIQESNSQVQEAQIREVLVQQQLEEACRLAEEAEVSRQVRADNDDHDQMQLDDRVGVSGFHSNTGGMDLEGMSGHKGVGEMIGVEVGGPQGKTNEIGAPIDVEDNVEDMDRMRVEGALRGVDGGERIDIDSDFRFPSPPRTPPHPVLFAPTNGQAYCIPPPAQYHHSAAQGYRLLSPVPRQATSTATPSSVTHSPHEHCVPVSAIASIVDQMKASPSPSPSPRQRQHLRPTALYCQKEIERKSDPVRTKFLADIRPHMNLLLKITHDTDILVSSARMENVEAVTRFEAGETDEGPTLNPMQPSWTSLKGGWNRVLGMLFAEHLIRAHGFDVGKKELIQAVFQERLDRLRALIRKNPRSDGEADAVYLARAKRGRPEVNSSARVHARRATVFQRRCKVASAARDDPEEAAAWEKAYAVLVALDANGMSSDESDYEGGSKGKTRIRSVPWRARGITSLMKLIDSNVATTNAAGGQKAGNPGLKRVRERLPKASRRRAKRGLPVNYYNAEWYQQLSAQEKVELGALPEEEFPHTVCWVEVINLSSLIVSPAPVAVPMLEDRLPIGKQEAKFPGSHISGSFQEIWAEGYNEEG
ncbi:hypothetical protein BKA70DRAFT_1220042 [Coprinopsis sp. MPI-PUGE-AT-0042]|nr:hypothetical protein BKA70DRAFT_1220042 [Coprinopsis sp. MPI-PUGE-AT-0042]